MQATETAIAHDQHMLAAAQRAEQTLQQRIQRRGHMGTRAQLLHGGWRIPTEIRRRVDPRLIRASQRLAERIGMHAHAHGVRTWLQHRDDALRANTSAQTIECGGDGRWMMSEIVIDTDAADGTAQFHAASDTTETAERFD